MRSLGQLKRPMRNTEVCTDSAFSSQVKLLVQIHWAKLCLVEVLCYVCWRMKIRSDPSAKCLTTVLKLSLLTAHFFTVLNLQTSGFLRIVHPETSRNNCQAVDTLKRHKYKSLCSVASGKVLQLALMNFWYVFKAKPKEI